MREAEHFSVDLIPDRDLIVVKLLGELDPASRDALKHEFDELRDAGFRYLILDLGQVDFMDSTGLGIIIAAAQELHRLGGRLELRNARSQVRRVVQLTGVDDAPWLCGDDPG